MNETFGTIPKQHLQPDCETYVNNGYKFSDEIIPSDTPGNANALIKSWLTPKTISEV